MLLSGALWRGSAAPQRLRCCVLLLGCLLLGRSLTEVRAQAVASAKFRTCPACRLNYLPEVKRFLKTEIEPGNYPHVTVEYIFGHNPEVIFYDAAGRELGKRRVDDLNFIDLHDLLKSKGLEHAPGAGSQSAWSAAMKAGSDMAASVVSWSGTTAQRRRQMARKLAGTR